VQDVFRYTIKGIIEEQSKTHEAIEYLSVIEEIKTTSKNRMLKLIEKHKLPMEVIPSERRDKDVYRLMIDNYGITALLRNLGNLSSQEVLVAHDFEIVDKIIKRLTNIDLITRGRVHPLSILNTMKIYAQGHGLKGKNSWTPVPDVLDALDHAFYLSFQAVEPTGKTRLLAIDVSASMGWNNISNTAITPMEGSAALAMVTYQSEKKVIPLAFSHEMVSINMRRKDTLAQVIETFQSIRIGATDCALPMLWAIENNVTGIDSFEILTDSETFFGKIHPVQALNMYREKFNQHAKLIVVGMVANKFSIADPTDKGMLDVVGFDTTSPQIMAEFVKGNI